MNCRELLQFTRSAFFTGNSHLMSVPEQYDYQLYEYIIKTDESFRTAHMQI